MLVGTLAGHRYRVVACAFSPDGALVASASDSTLKLWEVASGRERATLAGHDVAVTACAFSPDGGLLASAGDYGPLRLWDVPSGHERARLAGHGGWVTACAFSPDGALVVSASHDKTLKLWEVASGRERATLAGHDRGVVACAFSPDGALLATAGRDGTARLWEVAGGRERASIPLAGALNCLALAPEPPAGRMRRQRRRPAPRGPDRGRVRSSRGDRSRGSGRSQADLPCLPQGTARAERLARARGDLYGSQLRRADEGQPVRRRARPTPPSRRRWRRRTG